MSTSQINYEFYLFLLAKYDNICITALIKMEESMMAESDNEKLAKLLELGMLNSKSIRETISCEINAAIREYKDTNKKQLLEKFGQNLKKFREEKGFSQIQIANMVGIRAPNYNRYENGQNEPGALTAAQIATILDLNVSDLFCLNPDNKLYSALKILSYYDKHDVPSAYDGDDTVNLLYKGKIYKLSLADAEQVIDTVTTLVNPIINNVIVAQLTRLDTQQHPIPQKRIAGVLKPKEPK